MVTNLANRVMTTKGQKACMVIDHLVESLAGDPSSPLRRALILIDIDQHSGSTQTGVMERLSIHKSALNREIEGMFNYGCIVMRDAAHDGRAKSLEVCGYSKTGLKAALRYFDGDHQRLKDFLDDIGGVLKQEKPTLRDAKIVTALFEMRMAPRQKVMDSLYNAPPTSNHRAINKLIEEGIVKADGS